MRIRTSEPGTVRIGIAVITPRSSLTIPVHVPQETTSIPCFDHIPHLDRSTNQDNFIYPIVPSVRHAFPEEFARVGPPPRPYFLLDALDAPILVGEPESIITVVDG